MQDNKGEPRFIISPGSESTGFYYAYCKTEKKKLGNYTNQETVAQNTADYHASETKHDTSVETYDAGNRDDTAAVMADEIPCAGNACGTVLFKLLEGPSLRARNQDPKRVVSLMVTWGSIWSSTDSNYELWPGDEEIFKGPEGYIGVEKVYPNFK
jgi:hypothetical protein